MCRLTRRVVKLVPFALAAACSNSAQFGTPPTEMDEPSLDANALTDVERAAGWQLLFDGRSTVGWRGFRQIGVPAGWRVVNGALTRESGGGDLITTDDFSNFELRVQWQIAERGNSGIMYRV